RERKGDMRRLLISRINVASRAHGIPYNQLMSGLKKSGININRKLLVDMAVRDTGSFAFLVVILSQSD
ncbi:MAG: 50S ribosomal protein L20, partial [Dehalococcoidales bacterium]|nr:50S ribosomal protein L20 [Dehalococcoidales bacterium]